ncbi:hypothetical protein [Fundidesulfovibrio soli]|uniref:hypothetical protein n=1 Tax=Fundidesulfovibrio soli TaxID=2922716 RepID=UPI001FAE98AA|nr:hypothetical protein [Fundidesulfovibrio soli]
MDDADTKGGQGLPAWAGEGAGLYRNKKNGKLYVLLSKAVDCTNERDGLPVVVYCPRDDPAFVSVREEREFLAKFDPA